MERVLGRKIYDRTINLYTQDYYFPNWAKKILPSKNIKVHNKNVDIKYNWQLRDYQISALMHVIENEWWIIEAPTWAWKSAIVMWITSYLKTTTLIVCPTKKLVKEMVDKFKEFTNYEPWTYYSDGKNIKDITITTHSSFASDISWKWDLKNFANVIVDECDDKLSYKMICALCKCNCDILVWMSWTPDRQELDINDMTLIFGPYIKVWEYQMKPESVTHHIYKWSQDEILWIDYRNWHTLRESVLLNKKRFNSIVDRIKELCSKSYLTLILLDRIEEIESYAEALPEAIVITWKTKVKDDEKLIDNIVKTWWIIIWSIKKMYRWIDIPPIDNVIIASPIKFENTVIQSVWRALRRYKWKTKVDISIINDDILNNQRYEQSKAIKAEYWLKSLIVYI